jgi:hypothetical protein
VCRAVSLADADAERVAALDELKAEAALPDAGFRDHADDLAVSGAGLFEGGFERLQIRGTSDEAREAAAACYLEARAVPPRADEPEHADGAAHTLDGHGAEVVQIEVSGDDVRCGFTDTDRLRRSNLFHALCQADRVSLGRVVHAQIVTDRADDHLAGVDADPHGEVEPARQSKLIRVGVEGVTQMQRGIAGALGVILMRDWRTEQRHDAVAGEFVDVAFEALDSFRQDSEEALHDLQPLLRIHLLGQRHRALDVGEQHGHQLALALEGGARAEDLVSKVLGEGGGRGSMGGRGSCRALRLHTPASAGASPSQGLATPAAELLVRFVLFTAGGTHQRERGSALRAKPSSLTILVPAPCALRHRLRSPHTLTTSHPNRLVPSPAAPRVPLPPPRRTGAVPRAGGAPRHSRHRVPCRGGRAPRR